MPQLLLVDDHALFRTGLALVIHHAMPDTEVLEARSLEEVMALPSVPVDAVLLDIQLDGVNGLECIAPIRRKWPGVPVVVVSAHAGPQAVGLALSRGASDFHAKADPADRLVGILRRVLQPGAACREATATAAAPRAEVGQPALSPRQAEVMDLLHRGLSNKLIARELKLSENTVRRHVQDILQFFDVGNRLEAVYAARRRGLVG